MDNRSKTPPSELQDALLDADFPSSGLGISRLADRLSSKLSKDSLVMQVTEQLRTSLAVDRVALYYFYSRWKGQVTFESLSDESLSIIGMTGADECFNQDYARMYLEGRIQVTPDVSQAEIQDCHREFLNEIQVRANLVVPVLTESGLWGLLAAHHCTEPRAWTEQDIATMKAGASQLASAPSIRQVEP